MKHTAVSTKVVQKKSAKAYATILKGSLGNTQYISITAQIHNASTVQRKLEMAGNGSGVEPKTGLLFRMLNRATGDSWELRPLNSLTE